MTDRTLTDLERRMLEFERGWQGRRGPKEAEIRAVFGWTHIAYEAKLRRLLQDPAAVRYDAVLVHDALRLREGRAKQRQTRMWRRAS